MVALVFIALFIIIFGVFYLHFSTRNKERMALIEKGGDASIFLSSKVPRESRKSSVPIWKLFLLNISVLLMGVGSGVFLGAILEAYTVIPEEVGYTGAIFLLAGLGLFIGFTLSKKLVEKE